MASYSLVYRTTLLVTVGTADVVDDGNGRFHKDYTIPAVKLGSTFVRQTPMGRRIGDEYDATVKLVNTTTLRLSWYGDPDATEGLLTDESTGLDEVIESEIEVVDFNAIGNDLQEILFRLGRTLGLLGENCMNDLMKYDAAGNCVQYRLRVFDTRAHSEAATPDRPDGTGMQPGELSRITMTQDIDIGKNDRALMMRVLTDLIATPGVS